MSTFVMSAATPAPTLNVAELPAVDSVQAGDVVAHDRGQAEVIAKSALVQDVAAVLQTSRACRTD